MVGSKWRTNFLRDLSCPHSMDYFLLCRTLTGHNRAALLFFERSSLLHTYSSLSGNVHSDPGPTCLIPLASQAHCYPCSICAREVGRSTSSDTRSKTLSPDFLPNSILSFWVLLISIISSRDNLIAPNQPSCQWRIKCSRSQGRSSEPLNIAQVRKRTELQ